MKKIFLGTLALATSISCFSLTSKRETKSRTLNNEVKKANTVYESSASGASTHYYTDKDYEDDVPNNAQKIEDDNVYISGTIEDYNDFERLGYRLIGYETKDWDHDWFTFSTKTKSLYSFAVFLPHSNYKVSIRKYRGYEEEGSDIKEGKLIDNFWGDTSFCRSLRLDAGTYFICVSSMQRSTIVENQQYVIRFSKIQENEPTFALTGSNSIINTHKAAIWVNDLSPDNENFNRFGKDGQKLANYYGHGINIRHERYTDPLFQRSNTYLDSVIYIWDKEILFELANIMNVYYDEVDKALKQEKINEIKNAQVTWDNAEGFVLDLIGCIPIFSEAVSSYSLTNDGVSAVLGIVNHLISNPDIINSELYLGAFIGTIKALAKTYSETNNPNQVICLPRYSYVQTETEVLNKDFMITNDVWHTTYAIRDNYYKSDFTFDEDYISQWQYVPGLQESYHGDVRVFESGSEMSEFIGQDLAEYINLGNNAEQVVVLKDLTLSGDYPTQFYIGQPFDYSGLTVQANYYGAESKTITHYAIDYSQVDLTRQGEYPVYITFTDGIITKTTSYKVYYRVPVLTSITLSGNYQTEFHQGDAFSSEGLIVTANYDIGPSREITNYVINIEDGTPMMNQGNNLITVTYTENGVNKDASYYAWVEVDYPVIQYISLEGNYKTEFVQGEPFSYEGLIVIAHYDKGEPREVTNYEIVPPQVMNYSYEYLTVSVYYTENDKQVMADYKVHIHRELNKIEVSGNYPTSFEFGDSFSSSGMTVKAVYKDGSKKTLTSDSYTVDHSEVNMVKTGIYKVYVSCTEYGITCTFTYLVEVKYLGSNPKPWQSWIDIIGIGGGGIIIPDPGIGGGIGGGFGGGSGNF